MFRPWRALAVILVVAEIMSLWWLGKTLGFFGFMAYLLISGVAGMQLIRQSGAGFKRAFSMAQGAAGNGDVPQDAVASMLKAIAGVLVIMPGLVSDVAALLLLLPQTRQKVAKLLPFRMGFSVNTEGWSQSPSTDSNVIDGEATEIVEPDKRLR